MKETKVKILKEDSLTQIAALTKLLNPDMPIAELESRLLKMFAYDNYTCFGLYENDQLIGVSSGWISIRLYSNRQLEMDNVIIHPSIQSKGYGKLFMKEIESWAKANDCQTVELKTYVENGRSHKFYFNQGFHILGFHFQKNIN